MNFLEHKIPPPLVLLFTVVLIKIIAGSTPTINISADIRIIFAIIFIIAGVCIDVTALFCFRKAKTTINPLNPSAASNLVIVGIYRYTRNPMYLGLIFILFGVVVYYSSVFSLVAVAMFVAYITRFQIIPEERAMLELFGDEFTNYRQQVRRWL